MNPLERFREVVFLDSEFKLLPGEPPQLICICGKLWRSGRTFEWWHTEMEGAPPFPLGDDILLIAFTAAEAEVLRVLGIVPKNYLDLRVEHINQTNLSEKRDDKQEKLPRSLIDVLRSYGIPDGDAALKDEIRSFIINADWPAIEARRGDISPYCLSDATALEPLCLKLLPGIRNFDQALRRGDYSVFTAGVSHNGMPFDPWAMSWLRRKEVRQALRLRLVSDETLSLGVYDGETLRMARLAEFVIRHNLPWPRTRTGRLSISNDTFERIAKDRPEFSSLAEIRKTLGLLREFKLAAGADDRCRTTIWPFSTITGRMAPDGSAYPFCTAAWTRHLITPQPGTALAYLDFASMEFGVAAGLSRCDAMAYDYAHGDPYLGLGIEARLAPLGATPRTHGPIRERLKPMVLAIQYGGGGGLVAHRLGVDRRAGDRLVDLHNQKYVGYWDWSDRRLYTAFADGLLITRDGWQCKVTSRTPEFTARNWLVQANSSGVFRYGGLMADRLGIKVCAIVHDALAIEAPEDRIEEDAARAALCLERASALFLHDLVLRVDTKIIREGERFTDKRGTKIWNYVESTLKELPMEMRDVA